MKKKVIVGKEKVMQEKPGKEKVGKRKAKKETVGRMAIIWQDQQTVSKFRSCH